MDENWAEFENLYIDELIVIENEAKRPFLLAI